MNAKYELTKMQVKDLQITIIGRFTFKLNQDMSQYKMKTHLSNVISILQ